MKNKEKANLGVETSIRSYNLPGVDLYVEKILQNAEIYR